MKWLHFILSHSIFIAVCAVALAFQTAQLLKLDINLFVYGFIFFATLCSYNFYWILSKLSFAPKKKNTATFKKRNKQLFASADFSNWFAVLFFTVCNTATFYCNCCFIYDAVCCSAFTHLFFTIYP